MTGYNKVFLDTAPVIYFLDDDANFGKKARIYLKKYWEKGRRLLLRLLHVQNI